MPAYIPQCCAVSEGSHRGPGSITVYTVVLSPALIAQGTTAEQTFTLNGLDVNDYVYVNKPTTQAGLGIAGARVSAANTLAIAFANVPSAGGNITPTASQVYTVLAVRGG